MSRYVAPAGAPIRFADLLRWTALAASRTDVSAALHQELCARFSIRHAFLTCTGRAGLTLLLRAMRRLAPSHRDEVVVPSYTCYSVAASVVKAGLRPRIVDVSPATIDYDPAELENTDFSRVLALVATNLYGLPNDLPALAKITRGHGVFLIDDAAQAMGASVAGRWSGTWGDAGLFSFDKGKNVSAIDGGAVVTDSNDLAAALESELAMLPRQSISQSGIHVAKALAYFAMLRPSLYGIPARIPQLGLGQTAFTTAYPLVRPDPVLAALALTMIKRLDVFTRARQANARALLDAITVLPGVRTIAPTAGSCPVYLRLPVLAERAERAATIRSLNAAGIGASASYPASIADVPELRSSLADANPRASGGRLVASRIITLPTHPLVGADDLTRTISRLARGTDTTCAA